MHRPVSQCHNFAVLSVEAVAKSSPSGEKLQHITCESNSGDSFLYSTSRLHLIDHIMVLIINTIQYDIQYLYRSYIAYMPNKAPYSFFAITL